MTAILTMTDTELEQAHQQDCEDAHGAAVEFALVLSDMLHRTPHTNTVDLAAVDTIVAMIVGYAGPVGDTVWFDAMQSTLGELRACVLNTQRRLGVDTTMRQWINTTVDMLLIEID